jgi:uncharacterized protein (TIGR00369 family)
MTLIYKICPAPLWREAEASGVFRGAPVDVQDGFIHFSTARQLAATADKHFRGLPDLLLLEFDGDELGAALRFEPSRGGALFPHLYEPLPVSAVKRRWSLLPDADGRPVLPDLETMRRFRPEEHGWQRRQGRGFFELVGPVWSKGDGEARRMAFLAEERHLNGAGVVHGGMLMAFADQALGSAAHRVSAPQRQVTVQLDTHFTAAVRAGDFVEATCRIVRQTRSLIFVACTLSVGNEVVSVSNGVWKVLGPPKDQVSVAEGGSATGSRAG